MERRRCLWWFSVICTLSIAFGYLSRPLDEFSSLRELHPREEFTNSDPAFGPIRPEHRFYFNQPIQIVEDAAFRLSDENEFMLAGGLHFQLRSGAYANFQVADYYPPDGSTCRLIMHDDQLPWLTRCWLGLRGRLGL
jgi:hypothetical protein